MIALQPAIVVAHAVATYRFYVNGEDAGVALPRDFLMLPKALRWTVPLHELRGYLPVEFRRLPAGLLASLLLGNLPGLPGAIMSGGIKQAWLFTEDDEFPTPPDWNKRDNIIHALGAGGDGHAGAIGSLDGFTYGCAGGAGAAWAALVNHVLVQGQSYNVSVALDNSSDTSFDGIDVLLAASGSDGGGLSGGNSSGGNGGQATDCVGDLKSSGGDGQGRSGKTHIGGNGGGAGGPHGDGVDGGSSIGDGYGDAGQGGRPGAYQLDPDGKGHPGTEGLSRGFNPGNKVNAGSGGGGAGAENSLISINGGDGGEFGAGAGGGGFGTGVGGHGASGCLLAINNVSA